MKFRKSSPSQPSRLPVGNQWILLLKKAIAMAQKTKDPRLGVLQQAMRTATAESVLRKMSIICEADLRREFPDSLM
jgi:hypothetical protein